MTGYNQTVASSTKQSSQTKRSTQQPFEPRPDEVRLIQALRRAQTDVKRRERLLDAILTEDESDLIISLRRQGEEKPVPWEQVRADVLRDIEIINRNAARLNRQARDTLEYQQLP